MDNKILRFYNQNRYLVWTVILTIVGIIVLIQTLNNFIVQKNQTESQYNNTEMIMKINQRTIPKTFSVNYGKSNPLNKIKFRNRILSKGSVMFLDNSTQREEKIKKKIEKENAANEIKIYYSNNNTQLNHLNYRNFFINQFNYTLFDYEAKTVSFYSDSIYIKDNSDNCTITIAIAIVISVICLVNFVYLFLYKYLYK